MMKMLMVMLVVVGVGLTAMVQGQDFGLVRINGGTVDNFSAEGVAWSWSRGGFLMSSLAEGRVSLVRDASLNTRETFSSVSALISTAGIDVNEQLNLVAVANGGFTGAASIVFLRLDTGALLGNADVDTAAGLSADTPKLVNDCAIDPSDGAAYCTESFLGLVFRATSSDNEASVFVNNSKLAAPDPATLAIGANGIEYFSDQGDGYLIVCRSGATPATAALFVIKIDEPDNVITVQVEGASDFDRTIEGFDGMQFDAGYRWLWVYGNNKLYTFVPLTGDWTRVRVVAITPTEIDGATLAWPRNSDFEDSVYLTIDVFNPDVPAGLLRVQVADFSSPASTLSAGSAVFFASAFFLPLLFSLC